MSTPEIMHCVRHPKVETAITCASCGTPICPKCLVPTPVGMKCPDCGTNKKSPLYQVSPGRLLLAGLVAFIAGMGASIIGEIGFLAIFVASAYGYFAGTIILKASGMKRGLRLELATGAGVVLGAFALRLFPVVFRDASESLGHAALSLGLQSLLDPFFWVALVITTGAAVSRIRYL